MFINYLKTAWRNIRRNKTFSILNIAGLATGIVCASLIFLWANYRYQYNRQLDNAANIYQVKNNQTYGNDVFTMSATMGPLARTMEQEMPGVQNAVRLQSFSATFFLNNKKLNQSGTYADKNFFEIFSFPFIKKSTEKPLESPDKMAVSTKMAKAFFGNENAVGKSIRLGKDQFFTISAVYEIPSENMTVTPDWVVSVAALPGFEDDWRGWGGCGLRTYAALQPGVDVNKINASLKDLVRKKSDGTVNHSVFLYPYTDLGLYNYFENGKEVRAGGQIKYVKMFLLIAAIILLIACINFMNLATAHSEKRAKAIGMRKIIGANTRTLITQFYTESLLTSMFAVVLAALLLLMMVPLFGKLVDIDLWENLFTPANILGLLFVGLVCGIVSGSYPALYLSSINPLQAVNFRRSKYGGSVSVRRILVVFQFAISIMLLISIIVVYYQISHNKNRDLGFDKANILVTGKSDRMLDSYDAFKQKLLATGQVQDVALASGSMFNMYSNGGGFKWKGKEDTQEALITHTKVSHNYLQMMNIPLTEGRYFNTNAIVDSTSVIINESLAKLMGNEGHAGGLLFQGEGAKLDIVGVTNNFVYNDITQKNPAPMFFYTAATEEFKSWGSVFIRLKPSNNAAAQIAAVQQVYKDVDADFIFDYSFLDASFNRLLSGMQFIGKLAIIFAMLAIFISCLGLFGLSAFMAEQRTKEIGIRKVLGASAVSITVLLNKDFLKLVFIACIIAFPIAWWLMNKWLQNYEYRVEIHWWIFLAAALVAAGIALFTVSYQAIKAAKVNPVKTLKAE